MKKYGWLILILILVSIFLLISPACTNLDPLTGLREFLKVRVPSDTPATVTTGDQLDENPVESLETEAPLEDVSPLPIIWDDDGSPDGMIALMYFLQNPKVDVKAITVSCGEAYPHEFALLLERMRLKLDRIDIPIGAGSELPLEGTNAFPTPWRVVTGEFWGIELPEIPNPTVPLDAAELIVDVLNTSTKPVTIFVSGTLTNLAQALRIQPSIKYKIRSVEIMGGALFIHGNIASDWHEATNETAEWNIYVDPVAAAEVLSADVPINLTPLDATNQVVWTRKDVNSWQDSENPEAIMANQLLTWMLDEWFEKGVYVWDVVAAVNLTHPELCEREALYVEVSTEIGPEEGRTVVIDGKSPNLIACLHPYAQDIRNHVIEVFTGK